MAAGPAFNVSELIDTRPLGALQIRIVALCTLVALLDGLDLQSIGLAAPGIAADLHIPPPSLAAVFSAALAGLALGVVRLRRFGRPGRAEGGADRGDRLLRDFHHLHGARAEF